MGRFVFTIFFAACGLVQAKQTETSKNVELKVPGVGMVRIQHDVVGEPISQPERLQIFVTCEGESKSFRFAVYRMCSYKGHSYEAGLKALTLTLYYGRVEPRSGDVVCDQFDQPQIELVDACRDRGR